MVSNDHDASAPLIGRERRAGAAFAATCLDVGGAQAAPRPASEPAARARECMKAARGRGCALERRAGDRHERHDERIDAERDQARSHVARIVFARVAESRPGYRSKPARGRTPAPRRRRRRDSARPEPPPCRASRACAPPASRLRDACRGCRRRRLSCAANQTSSSGGSHCAWIGRSTAAFTAVALSAQNRRRRDRAPRGVPVVITICLTPSSSTAAFATSASCAGVLRSMVRPAASDWPMAQNWQVLVRLW